jgi:hypothetical protein
MVEGVYLLLQEIVGTSGFEPPTSNMSNLSKIGGIIELAGTEERSTIRGRELAVDRDKQ